MLEITVKPAVSVEPDKYGRCLQTCVEGNDRDCSATTLTCMLKGADYASGDTGETSNKGGIDQLTVTLPENEDENVAARAIEMRRIRAEALRAARVTALYDKPVTRIHKFIVAVRLRS